MDELTIDADFRVKGEGKKRSEPKIPEGYASVAEFLREARERFQEGVDADRDNREMALDDQKFIANEQWDEQVKAARLRKGRPCLTTNTLPQYLGQVVGDMLMNRPSIKVRPAEDGDKEIAEARQGIIRFIENQSNAEQVYVGAGESQVGCGIGHFRVRTVYSNDDSFDQDIRIEGIPNPFAVVWDAYSVEPTGADARFCFVAEEMPRKAFEAEYPDAQSSDLSVPLLGDWATKDTVRVTEYWVMKEVKRTLALIQRAPDAQPSIEDVTEADDATLALIVRDAAGKPRTREKLVSRACMYLITGNDILAGPVEYAIKRFPIFKVTGRTQQVGERIYRYGLIRNAKDPIRLKNLSRSSAAEWISMAPKQQWLLHSSDKDQANRFRNAHKSGDPVLEWSGVSKPERIDPPSMPAALFQEAQFYDQDIKDVTGLHDASLGMKSNETSGKAILARERQGDTATAMYQFNLKAAIRECGRVINDLIPVVFDTARTLVALGEDGVPKQLRVNDPQSPEGHIDLKTGKYDIEIETGPSYSTRRVEAAESMMAFIQAVPNAAAIAGDLIASAQDWPDADKIAARLRKGLPPGMAEDDDESLSEEQRAQKAQAVQAQQAEQAEAKAMQKRAAELDLDEKQAQVLKTTADAQLTFAKARDTAKPDPATPETPLDDALKLQQVRIAEANAEKAEFDAQLAQLAVEKAKRELAVTLAMPEPGEPPEPVAAAAAAPPAQPPGEPPTVAASADE